MSEIRGGSFSFETLRVKLNETDAPTASVTSTVTVVRPVWFVAGASTIVRATPLPSTVIRDAGSRNGSAANARKRRLSTGVRSSLSVRGTLSTWSS